MSESDPADAVEMNIQLTPGQAADILKVSAATLRRLEERGDLRPTSHTPGGHARYRQVDVIRFLKSLGQPHKQQQS